MGIAKQTIASGFQAPFSDPDLHQHGPGPDREGHLLVLLHPGKENTRGLDVDVAVE